MSRCKERLVKAQVQALALAQVQMCSLPKILVLDMLPRSTYYHIDTHLSKSYMAVVTSVLFKAFLDFQLCLSY